MTRNLPTETASGLPAISDEQRLELVKTQIARGHTEAQLAYFLAVAERYRLDPLRRQIYSIIYRTKHEYCDGKGCRGCEDGKVRTQSIQIGIDGYRTIAHRTEECAGIDEPVWGRDDYGAWCQVTVYRRRDGKEHRDPYTAKCYLKEFQKQTSMWRSMPRNQIAKCTEAQSLRKAFPEELGGTYIPEEMDGAEGLEVVVDAEVAGRGSKKKPEEPKRIPVSNAPVAVFKASLQRVCEAHKVTPEEVEAAHCSFGKTPFERMSDAERAWFVNAMDDERSLGALLARIPKRPEPEPEPPAPEPAEAWRNAPLAPPDDKGWFINNSAEVSTEEWERQFPGWAGDVDAITVEHVAFLDDWIGQKERAAKASAEGPSDG